MIPFLAPLLLKLPWLKKLRKLPWRWILIGIAAVAAAAWIWAQIAAYGSRREGDGRAAVQALWDANKADIQKLTDARILENATKEAAAAARNEEIEREYKAKLAAAAADTERTYGLLRQARIAANRRAGEAATGATIAIAASEASIAERIDRAVAGVVTEHRANSDQLDALIAVVKPQIEAN